MPINTQDMLLQTKPLSPLNLDISGGGGMSLERERLKLMREQFENTKRQQAEQMELGRLEEQGRMARERMTNERSRQQAEAQAAQQLQQQRQKTLTEFSTLNGKGDVEGARAMVPLMSSMGMSVDLMGQANGLPQYLVDMSEEDRQKRLAAEQAAESAEPPAPGIASTGDAFRAAQQSTSQSDITGEPTRAPERSAINMHNVLDMPGMAANTRARLDPVMSGLVNAYPAEQRQSARSTADAMMASGMPAQEAVKEFRAQRGGPDSAANSETVARGQSGNQAYSRRKEGFDQAQQTFKGGEHDRSLVALESAGQVREILTNDNREDDIQIVNLIVGMSGGKGTQTEPDIARALGLKSTSTLDQIKNYLETKVESGLGENQIAGILSYVNSAERRQKNKIFAWMDNVDQASKKPGADPDEAAGALKFRDFQVPRALRQEYEEAKKRGKRKPAGAGSFNMEQDSRAEYGDTGGLNQDALAGVIQAESGGNPAAVNGTSGATGLIQFMPEIAKGLGTTTEDLAKMSAEEQMPFVVKYLRERGIDENSGQGDMYMAIAAPAFVGKPDATVVYKKGSKEWEQNPAWRPEGGGDITVASIKAFGGGASVDDAVDPEKATAAKRARLEELRAKRDAQ